MASIPGTPATVVSANNGVNVDFTWTAPASNGGSTITSYTLKIKADSGSYVEDSVNCGTANILTCSVPMSVLIASPYLLDEGDLIVAQVFATNAVGDSSVSTDNTIGAEVQTIPATPTSAPTRNSATTATNIVVDIATVTADGGSAITSYSIEYKISGGTYSSIKGSLSDDLLLTASQAVTSGSTYYFRYLAKNIYGWSSASPEIEVLASVDPDAPTNVETENVDAYLVVTWDTPINTGGTGVALTSYRVTL